ncbi:unnamed protein product [Lampetra planeri]
MSSDRGEENPPNKIPEVHRGARDRQEARDDFKRHRADRVLGTSSNGRRDQGEGREVGAAAHPTAPTRGLGAPRDDGTRHGLQIAAPNPSASNTRTATAPSVTECAFLAASFHVRRTPHSRRVHARPRSPPAFPPRKAGTARTRRGQATRSERLTRDQTGCGVAAESGGEERQRETAGETEAERRHRDRARSSRMRRACKLRSGGVNGARRLNDIAITTRTVVVTRCGPTRSSGSGGSGGEGGVRAAAAAGGDAARPALTPIHMRRTI